ncbi:unnamed protein product [Amoebophrya sp. A120]|nr:unnamed protein product [Amoebophrya sp. A120]|eukprot:GSA120T00015539001.1
MLPLFLQDGSWSLFGDHDNDLNVEGALEAPDSNYHVATTRTSTRERMISAALQPPPAEALQLFESMSHCGVGSCGRSGAGRPGGDAGVQPSTGVTTPFKNLLAAVPMNYTEHPLDQKEGKPFLGLGANLYNDPPHQEGPENHSAEDFTGDGARVDHHTAAHFLTDKAIDVIFTRNWKGVFNSETCETMFHFVFTKVGLDIALELQDMMTGKDKKNDPRRQGKGAEEIEDHHDSGDGEESPSRPSPVDLNKSCTTTTKLMEYNYKQRLLAEQKKAFLAAFDKILLNVRRVLPNEFPGQSVNLPPTTNKYLFDQMLPQLEAIVEKIGRQTFQQNTRTSATQLLKLPENETKSGRETSEANEFHLAPHVLTDRRFAFWELYLEDLAKEGDVDEDGHQDSKDAGVDDEAETGVGGGPSQQIKQTERKDERGGPVISPGADAAADDWSALFAKITREEEERAKAEQERALLEQKLKQEREEQKRLDNELAMQETERELRAGGKKNAELSDELEFAAKLQMDEMSAAAERMTALQKQKKIEQLLQQAEELENLGEEDEQDEIHDPRGEFSALGNMNVLSGATTSATLAARSAAGAGGEKNPFFVPAFDAAGVKITAADLAALRDDKAGELQAGSTSRGVGPGETEEEGGALSGTGHAPAGISTTTSPNQEHTSTASILVQEHATGVKTSADATTLLIERTLQTQQALQQLVVASAQATSGELPFKIAAEAGGGIDIANALGSTPGVGGTTPTSRPHQVRGQVDQQEDFCFHSPEQEQEHSEQSKAQLSSTPLAGGPANPPGGAPSSFAPPSRSKEQTAKEQHDPHQVQPPPGLEEVEVVDVVKQQTSSNAVGNKHDGTSLLRRVGAGAGGQQDITTDSVFAEARRLLERAKRMHSAVSTSGGEQVNGGTTSTSSGAPSSLAVAQPQMTPNSVSGAMATSKNATPTFSANNVMNTNPNRQTSNKINLSSNISRHLANLVTQADPEAAARSIEEKLQRLLEQQQAIGGVNPKDEDMTISGVGTQQPGMKQMVELHENLATSDQHCLDYLLAVAAPENEFDTPDANLRYLLNTVGRIGEQQAREFFEKTGQFSVLWVNEEEESRLPFDLVLYENEMDVEAGLAGGAAKDSTTIMINASTTSSSPSFSKTFMKAFVSKYASCHKKYYATNGSTAAVTEVQRVLEEYFGSTTTTGTTTGAATARAATSSRLRFVEVKSSIKASKQAFEISPLEVVTAFYLGAKYWFCRVEDVGNETHSLKIVKTPLADLHRCGLGRLWLVM